MERRKEMTLCRLVCCSPGFAAAYLLAAWHLHSSLDSFFAALRRGCGCGRGTWRIVLR